MGGKLAARLFVCAAVGLFSICMANAQDARVGESSSALAFDLPALPLEEALLRVARLADRSVLFRAEAVKDVTSNPVRGVYRLDTALSLLLEGTSLKVDLSEPGVMSVLRRSESNKEGPMSKTQTKL